MAQYKCGNTTFKRKIRRYGRRAYMYPVEYLADGVGWNGVHEQLAPVIMTPNGTKEYQVSDYLAARTRSLT